MEEKEGRKGGRRKSMRNTFIVTYTQNLENLEKHKNQKTKYISIIYKAKNVQTKHYDTKKPKT